MVPQDNPIRPLADIDDGNGNLATGWCS